MLVPPRDCCLCPIQDIYHPDRLDLCLADKTAGVQVSRHFQPSSSGNDSSRPTIPPRPGPGGELRPQLTAFFTSAPIVASSVAVSSFSAKAVGHMLPSSRFAAALKPNVAYLSLNLAAGVKKQTTLPSLA
jgi:hypothetical protein